ncbi:histidinol-phosphate transaminase [Bartonella sp. HY329]|uniref:histidinol-phosphate transaminase n=1 Tax=unclassified Bartonella TaxID=2645622 RepID=UPI0021C7807E|nr:MULTISPECIES: histidinol-phosphate transaminase [unclassified Bartonella]UXM94916.1 histidinol-phosphate transaminase [Bartonella sp. HY329]UXN09239.1 histidinol-phosphate transaminase [Bartonella sp. HY328]
MTSDAIANRPQPRKGIMDIAAYVPGSSKGNSAKAPDKIYKLSSNETPLGAPPSALDAYRQSAGHLELYPDGQALILRDAIAEIYGLNPSNIMTGNGSDELLTLLAQTYLGAGDEGIMTEHGFSVYDIQMRAAGAKVVVAAEKDCKIDVDAIINCVSDKTKIVFIANPGNPTGTYLNAIEIRELHASLPKHVLLVLDGAYAEYVTQENYEAGIELVANNDNVVMTRTFSKIYGLAALRIGWMYAPAHIIDAIDRVRGPFNVNTPAQKAGAAAIRDRKFIHKSVAFNSQWREWLTNELTALGLKVTPSVTNFLLIHFPADREKSAAFADDYLKANGYILRRVTGYGFPNALRLSIGSEEANRGVVAALKEFLK